MTVGVVEVAAEVVEATAKVAAVAAPSLGGGIFWWRADNGPAATNLWAEEGGGNTTTTDLRCHCPSMALPLNGLLPNGSSWNHNDHPCDDNGGNGNASGRGRAIGVKRGGNYIDHFIQGSSNA